MLSRATGRAARPEKTDGSARSSWGLAPRKRRSHQGLRRCMYPRGWLPRRSQQMEHNQGCSPFYFSSQFSVLSSQLSVLPALSSQLSALSSQLSALSSQLSALSSQLPALSSQLPFFILDVDGAFPRVSCEWRSVFQQFCGKEREIFFAKQEPCGFAGCASESGRQGEPASRGCQRAERRTFLLNSFSPSSGGCFRPIVQAKLMERISKSSAGLGGMARGGCVLHGTEKLCVKLAFQRK